MSNTVTSDKTRRIYLDYAASTPLDPDVAKVMQRYMDDPEDGNPSSIYEDGRRARRTIEWARAQVADFMNASPEEIIFTGSGTEADNLAVLGAARSHKAHGDHIIVSAIEHKAVLEPARLLEKEGFRVTVLPVNPQGLVDVKECIQHITNKTILVSVMYANNEIGTIQPIQQLAQAIIGLRKKDQSRYPLLHTDACQATNLFKLDVKTLGIDLLSLNGSKMYGPHGIGVLYKKSDLRIDPIILGGDQERRLRAGTESIPLIVGFATAFAKAQVMSDSEMIRLSGLSSYFREGLKRRMPNLLIEGDPAKTMPSIVHVSIPDIEGESMLLKLDACGVRVSTGSACSAFDLRPSHVLLAIGQNPDLVHGSIRFSLGRNTTKDELDYVLEVFPKIVRELASMSALTITAKPKSYVS